ncbi:MAG: hemolysin family protein [Firmicutes bacterium]|nr:hemolysin family protein [Bacillota bacterium]
MVICLILFLLGAAAAALSGAVSAVSAGYVKKEAGEDEEKSAALVKIAEEPRRYLLPLFLVCQFFLLCGIAVAAAAYGPRLAAFLAARWPAASGGVRAAVTAAAALAAYLLLILFYQFPQNLACRHPEALLSRTFGPLRLLAALGRPGTAAAAALCRLTGYDPARQADAASEEKIRQMVDISGETGLIEPTERELIENIFEFNNMTAEDVMIHRKDMVMLYADDSHEEIMATIRQSGLSRFPVCGEDVDDIIGILRTREYLLNLENDPPRPLQELLAAAYFVPESVPTDVLFRDMQKKKIHMAIVVDEYGGTSGLITLEDLLEEIVGNIYDEYDPQEQKDIVKLGENLWKVSGAAELEELQKALNWHYEYPEDEYATLGGFIFSCLSEIPADGSKPEIEAAGLRIQVEEVKDRRVEWALVSLAEAGQDAPEA